MQPDMSDFVEGQDYCTAWFDGIPTWLGGTGHEFSRCCYAHDEFYAGYDGWLGYLGAHWDLAQCVGEVSWAMAAVMFCGLLTFGSGLIVHRKNRYGRRNTGEH